tara:strand:- start:2421 stop:3287 length:867 start_codon:yes stop_codon:yes gene_type:complete
MKNDSNPGIEEVLQGDTEDTGSDSFFDSLEQQVNGQVYDEQVQPQDEQVTQPQADSEKVQEATDWKSEAEGLKKRYSDSSREAQRLKAELEQVSGYAKYKPLIDHLNENPSAVQALRNNINGQNDLTTQFGEDFIFDGDEAVKDPNSDSAKALKQMIDQEANKRVNSVLNARTQQNQAAIAEAEKQRQVEDFVKRTGIQEAEFNELQDWASQRELTMDDIYYLKNRENAANNVANNTKQEMLNQMKAVRDIPASASNANSAPDSKSPDDAVFNILKGMDDEGVENLFG